MVLTQRKSAMLAVAVSKKPPKSAKRTAQPKNLAQLDLLGGVQ